MRSWSAVARKTVHALFLALFAAAPLPGIGSAAGDPGLDALLEAASDIDVPVPKAAAPAGAAGFSRGISPALEERLAGRFGKDAKARLENWRRFIRSFPAELRPGDESALELISSVNDYFNRIPFVPDPAHWHMNDYWASPAELVASGGGDCEDFAIAKYFALKELGVPVDRLRIIYVKSLGLGQSHMALSYYLPDGRGPFLLDNLAEAVLPASARTDLYPVFDFNEKELRVLNRDMTVAAAYPASRIKLWSGLLNKLQEKQRR